jgi:hypothetical protein
MANLARFPKDSEIKLNLIEIVVRWLTLVTNSAGNRSHIQADR